MTNKQILERAIQKALDNGWEPQAQYGSFSFKYISKIEYPKGNILPESYDFTIGDDFYDIEDKQRCIVFNHDFNKALWGDNFSAQELQHVKLTSGSDKHFLYRWEYHLQIMVINPDPIKYLEYNLDQAD